MTSGSPEVSSSCSSRRHVTLVTDPVISHEWGKNRIVITTTYIRGHFWQKRSVTEILQYTDKLLTRNFRKRNCLKQYYIFAYSNIFILKMFVKQSCDFSVVLKYFRLLALFFTLTKYFAIQITRQFIHFFFFKMLCK